MSELLKLAERVEKATGPDRELDALITVALDLRADWLRGQEGEIWFGGEFIGSEPVIRFKSVVIKRRGQGNPPSAYCPAFTASLDAAMALAEPFMLVALSDIAADGLTGCCLCSDTSTNPPKEHWGIPIECSGDRQGILARAVCAAALRGRAAQSHTR